MKKLDITVILIQIFGIIFLINGILQLRFYTVAEKVVYTNRYFQDQKSENFNRCFPTQEDYSNFWPNVYVWIFLGLLIGISIVCYFNWKNKLSSLNTILIAIVLYIVLRLKFFRRGILSNLFQSFWALLSNDFATQRLIQGITFTVIGIVLLWISIKQNLFNSRKKIASN